MAALQHKPQYKPQHFFRFLPIFSLFMNRTFFPSDCISLDLFVVVVAFSQIFFVLLQSACYTMSLHYSLVYILIELQAHFCIEWNSLEAAEKKNCL